MFLHCNISDYSILLKGMENCLGEIETVWLAGGQKQFLAGDAISVRNLIFAVSVRISSAKTP